MAADLLAILIKTNLVAAAAVVVVLALRRMVRGVFGARVAYALWLAVPVAVAASLLPSRTIALRVEGSMAQAELAPLAAGLDGAPAVLFLWLAGVVISFGLLAWSQSRFIKSLGGVVREGQILRARAAGPGPAVVGALFPRIVVPADFEDRYDASEQKVVLAHEAAHLACGDAVINAVVALAQCLFWFNPMIHVASRVLRVDQELACDAAVLKAHPQLRLAYAQALLKTQLATTSLPVGCYWPAGGANPLKERIAMLTIESPSRSARLAGGASVLVLCLGLSAAAWAAQPARVVLEEGATSATLAPLGPVALAPGRPRPAPLNPAPTIPTATSIAGNPNPVAATATSLSSRKPMIQPRLPPPNLVATTRTVPTLTPSSANLTPPRTGSQSIVVPKPFTADVKAQTLQQVDAWIARQRAEGKPVDHLVKARDDLAAALTVD